MCCLWLDSPRHHG